MFQVLFLFIISCKRVLSAISSSQQPTVLFSIYQNNTWTIRCSVDERIYPATQRIILKIVRFQSINPWSVEITLRWNCESVWQQSDSLVRDHRTESHVWCSRNLTIHLLCRCFGLCSRQPRKLIPIECKKKGHCEVFWTLAQY